MLDDNRFRLSKYNFLYRAERLKLHFNQPFKILLERTYVLVRWLFRFSDWGSISKYYSAIHLIPGVKRVAPTYRQAGSSHRLKTGGFYAPSYKDRVYIVGLSMVGMGTFEAVYRYPKLFAAAAPVCGGGDADAYKKRHARIPFWIFHGEEDGVVEVEESWKMYKRLKALSAEVKYTEYPGVNHNSWENTYAEADLLPWLFGQKR